MSTTLEPAFPAEVWDESKSTGEQLTIYPGMTLRDYFAAKAMQSVYLTLERIDQFKPCAIDAYLMADAMLEARKEAK